MPVNAMPFIPKINSLMPSTQAYFVDKQPDRASAYADHISGETRLSAGELCERLGLLAQLELPCSIFIATPHLHLRHTLIQTIEFRGLHLSIAGKDFSLCMRGANIGSIRLANRDDRGVSVEIYHSQGMLYARIQPSLEGVDRAVWRDVMDNPSLSLA